MKPAVACNSWNRRHKALSADSFPVLAAYHRKEKGDSLKHKEFLADADDDNLIRNFAKSMIADMPEDGSA